MESERRKVYVEVNVTHRPDGTANIVRINDRKFIHRFFLTIQVYYCKLNARFMIVNLQHKKERLSYVSMRDYKALCVAVIKCQQHNLIWDKTNR